MLIIGELINATRPSVGEAIDSRNDECIRALARRQHEAGADVIDLNAGRSGDREAADLQWMIEVIEDDLGRDIRLAIDTASTRAMDEAIRRCSATPMMNSLSNEPSKSELFSIAAECGCEVIGLAMGERGMPRTADARFAEAQALITKCEGAGIPSERLHVDLLCLSIASVHGQGRSLLEAIRRVKSATSAKTIAALSNISYGLPNRSLINRTYVAMLLEAGLDAMILDPTDEPIRDAICASAALLGTDNHCMDYIRHHRAKAGS